MIKSITIFLPEKIRFENDVLDEKQAKAAVEFLKFKFEDLLEDIDYYTDQRGDIILSTAYHLEKKLKTVI